MRLRGSWLSKVHSSYDDIVEWSAPNPNTTFAAPFPIKFPYNAKATTATASAAPTDPPICTAPPVNGVGVMPPAVGLDPLPLMLLTIKDGQGVPSDTGGLLRVTVTSGAGPVGQAVPQAARTVDCSAVR